MVTKVRRVGWGVVFLLAISLVLSLITVSSSSCQQSDYQFRASIWVDRGCGSSYSEGDSITIYYMIEVILVSSEESGGSSEESGGTRAPVIYSGQQYQHVAPPPPPPPTSPPDYSSIASISIIDYYPNDAGSQYLAHDRMCVINAICYLDGTVECNFGGSGIERLELIAEIFTETGIVIVGDNCYFYVNCGQEPPGSAGTPQPTSQSPPVNPAPACYDYDNDGYSNCDGDCNNYDPAVYPGAKDICDGLDNDCDREIDEDCQPSTITLTVSPESVSIDDAVLVSGILSPSRAADIHLIFAKPDSTMFTTVVNSDAEGTFSFSFEPESLGTWSVSAFAEGDSTYRAASSDKAFFNVKKVETSLSLRTTSTLLYPAEETTVSGTISPAMITFITIIIEDEKGNKQESVVSSLSDGTFSLSYRPNSVGKWSVSARFDGTQKYENSQSRTIIFTVTKEESAMTLNISPENERIIEGDSIEITGQIRPSRSTTVSLYLENDGKQLNFQVLSNEDGTFSHVFTPLSPGMWHTYAHVPEEATYTGVTSNMLSFFVESAIPDLAVSNVVVDPLSVEPNEKVKIYLEIENLGTGIAKEVTVRVSVNANTGKSKTTVYETTITEIGVREWKTVNAEWIALSGFDTIIIEIDPLNSISEISEENNRAAQHIDVYFKKDISIASVHFSSGKIEEGETVTIIAEIHCKGKIPEFLIEFWDGKRGEGSEIFTKILQNFSGEKTVEIYWTPTSGDHNIYVVADPSNKVNESDENNNIFESHVTVEKSPFPIAETAILVAAAASAGIYWYLKSAARSLSKTGRRISQKVYQTVPHGSGGPLGHAPSIPPGVEPAQGFSSLYHAKDLLLRAGQTTAATEIGGKLYRTLYSRYYHRNKAQQVDFEQVVQHKLDLLERVITHLCVFEGYIDTEEFCRFFNVDEAELLGILDFLYKNGYIERVAA